MVFCKTELAAAVAADQVLVGTNVKFERIRRITGYLVGTLDRVVKCKCKCIVS